MNTALSLRTNLSLSPAFESFTVRTEGADLLLSYVLVDGDGAIRESEAALSAAESLLGLTVLSAGGNGGPGGGFFVRYSVRA